MHVSDEFAKKNGISCGWVGVVSYIRFLLFDSWIFFSFSTPLPTLRSHLWSITLQQRSVPRTKIYQAVSVAAPLIWIAFSPKL